MTWSTVLSSSTLKCFWYCWAKTIRKTSTKSCLELNPIFSWSLLSICSCHWHCGVDLVFCLRAVPPDSPTALCGEKSALFNNYCTLAWLLQLSVQRWLSKCHMPMIETKNLLLPLSCVPRKMLFSRSLRNNSIFSFSLLSCPFFLVWFLTAMENGLYKDCLLIWTEMHL